MSPPGDKCRNRLFEWMTTGMMVGIVFTIAWTPATIQVGAFRYLLALGFTPTLLFVFFAVVGFARAASLYSNGRWPVWGPRGRAAGALLGGFIWGQMALALIFLTKDTGTLSIDIPVYVFLALGEAISCYRAAVDVRRHS